MRKPATRRFVWGAAVIAVVGLVAFDLSKTHQQRGYITLTRAEAGQDGPALVALATSQDLSSPVPLDSPEIHYDQIKELVYLAL
ncbi:MAG: hypothetical protein ABIL09_03645, partial [Gemmatimonadota bacterium]